ncbi:hypothetical protein FJZ18_03650 [Candidatus Pacearchaeota archaeon]|nr:hypothetical protein [Candidatus Pacearchaeota archaeon]
MINNRKGLSDIVTTVLIILLVLAAIAILSLYVLSFVNKGGTELEGSAECALMQLYPTECNYRLAYTLPGDAKATQRSNKDYPANQKFYSFSVLATKRGSTDVKLVSMNVILKDKVSGEEKSIPLKEGEFPKFVETARVYNNGTGAILYKAGNPGTIEGLGSALDDMIYESVSVTAEIIPEGASTRTTCKTSKVVPCVLRE